MVAWVEVRYVAGVVPSPVRWVMSRVFGRSYHREIAPVWRAQ